MAHLEYVLVTSLFLIFFAYFGYPISLLMMGLIRNQVVNRALITPDVTFIITVHNEEKRINNKLENTLDIDYPKEKLQIIVASDGSTDNTNKIVKTYSDKGILLLELHDRKGKENAQKEAIDKASGDIIIFSDVATIVNSCSLHQIISNFGDPTIGCVSSQDKLLTRDGTPTGESFYVRYEMWLRQLESRVGSLVNLSGSFFAARKQVCSNFSSEMQSDFRTVLNSIKLGLRGVSDPLTIGYYHDIADQKHEWDRKIRTVVRGLTVFFNHLDLLNPFRYKWFSYQLFCHKLLRWSVPFFMIIAFVSNLMLSFNTITYLVILLFHIAFYGLGISGLIGNKYQKKLIIKIPMYLLAVNVSILMAWFRYLTGQRIVAWSPTER